MCSTSRLDVPAGLDDALT